MEVDLECFLNQMLSQDANTKKGEKIFYLSPRGKILNQSIAREISKEKKVNLICGHFEGVDQRVLDNREIDDLSVGDFVLSGGETASDVFLDALPIPSTEPQYDIPTTPLYRKAIRRYSHPSTSPQHPTPL